MPKARINSSKYPKMNPSKARYLAASFFMYFYTKLESQRACKYPKMKQLIKGQISYKAVSYFQNERVQDITTEFWQLSTDFNEIVSKP